MRGPESRLHGTENDLYRVRMGEITMARKTWLLMVTVAMVFLLAGCGPGHEETADRPGDDLAPVRVETAVAALEQVPVVVEATGSVEPWKRVSPGTKIMGRVDEVLVDEGDRVHRGQVLARLERRDLDAAVRQAEAAVAMAKANLANMEAQYHRIVRLHEKGSATQKNLEDVTAGYTVAQAALQQAEANLNSAKVMLSYAEIVSPIDGWVVRKMTEVGDMAAPGMPMFVVEDLSRVKVTAQVPESDVTGMAPGQQAQVRIDVLGLDETADIWRVVPAGDPRSRTFAVQLVLRNPEGRIKSNMFARVSFDRGLRQALLVPQTAIVRRGQLRGVFVVDEENRARLRWVKLGREAGGRVEVLSGLTPGDRYVVAPPPGFADGTPVEE